MVGGLPREKRARRILRRACIGGMDRFLGAKRRRRGRSRDRLAARGVSHAKGQGSRFPRGACVAAARRKDRFTRCAGGYGTGEGSPALKRDQFLARPSSSLLRIFPEGVLGI